MGAENEGIQVAFGANIQGLTNGLTQATSGVQAAVKNIEGNFTGLAAVLENLKAPFMAFTGLLAGGAVFKGSLGAVIDMTGETAKLARQLGESTQYASGLREALDKLGIDTNLYGSAVFKLQMALRTQEEELRRNGVATRNSRGEHLSIQEIMMNGIRRLGEMGEGYDRNALSMLMWGRSAKEMQALQRLTNERLAEGYAETKKLGTSISTEQVAATRAYKEAMVDVKDVFEAIQVQIGSRLLPVLTNLARWFGENGPAIIGPTVKAFEALAQIMSYTTVQVALLAAALYGPMTAAWAKASTAVIAFAQTLMVQMRLATMQGITGVNALVQSLVGMINPWVLVAAVVVGAGIALERWSTSASRAAQAQLDAARRSAETGREFDDLASKALKLDAVMRDTKATDEQKKRAQEQMKLVLAQLNAAYPNFNQYLKDEHGNQRSIAEAIEVANKAREKSIKLNLAEAEAKLQNAIIDAAADKAWQDSNFVTRNSGIVATRVKASQEAVEKLRATVKAYQTELMALQGDPSIPKGKKAGDTFKDKPDKEKEGEQLREWKDGLTKQLEAQSAFFNDSIQMSLAYWRNILATQKLSAQQRQEINREVFKLEKAEAVQAHETKLEQLRAELDAFGQHSEARLEKQRQVIAEELRVHKGRTKEVIAAEKELARMEREIEAERQALRVKTVQVDRDVVLARIQADEEALGRKRELGQVSAAEDLAAQIQLENRRFMARRAAIAAELDDMKITEQRKKELQGQEEILEIEHQDKLKQIRHKAAMDSSESMKEFFQPLTSAFQSSLEGMLNASMIWQSAMKNLWKGVGQMIDQMIVRSVMSWITGEKTKTAATQMSVLQRVAMETWAVMKSVALAVWAGLKWIAIKGYEAMAGAYSAIASIPYVGPFLAPVVAAGVLASVISLGSKIASASGGWETVPHDQLAMIHKDEQVLPASYATGLRQLIKGGGAAGGPQEVHQHTWNVQTIDASSFEDFLMTKGQAAVVKVSREAARNGRMG